MIFVPPVPESARPESIQIDSIPMEYAVTRAADSKSFVLDLKLSVPEIGRMSKVPNNTAFVDALDAAIKTRRVKVRITLVADSQIESEFERLQDDGSIRELLPQEGTW